MRRHERDLVSLVLAFMAFLPGSAALGQEGADAPAPAEAPSAPPSGFGTDQLEQLVAPIALYPDTLLTQVLMASTYPLEIVEADRWVRQNEGLAGAELDEALKNQDWDPSVKSLCHVPDVVARMSENLDWTQDLGDAFLAQQSELMDTVQRMRAKAYEAGNLKSSEQQVVTQQSDKIIIIESPDPEVVYVPTYSPTVVYGPGWYYPSWYYPPMYYPPPPGYGFVAFSFGVIVGGAIWGNCNWGWGHTDIDIDIDRYNNFNRNTSINPHRTNLGGDGAGQRAKWQHDPSHRKGVNYPSQDVARRFGASEGASRVSRDQARGRAPAGVQSADRAGGRGAGGAQAGRPSASTGQLGGRGAGRDTALSGSRNSGFDRAASSRGSFSRGTTSFGGAPAMSRGRGRR